MAADDPKLLDLAGRLSDGDAVDWAGEERGADAGQRGVIRHLRLLSDIAQVHAGVDASAAPPPATLAAEVQPTLAEPGAQSSPAPRSWGHLEIRETLGSGSFGEVYRAWDGTLRRDVALKLLKQRPGSKNGDPARRVLHEGRMLAKLRHPGVVLVHGADVHDGRVGLWMEFVRGRTLEELRRAQGTFGAREATLIGIDLCRALAAVHGAGLVHRDVKAHNVMREDGGRIVLMDFGSGEDRSQAVGRGSVISGTPLYIAPEIYEGTTPDARSDIYSVGVLLFNLVTGRFPVEAHSLTELRELHGRREFSLLRDLRSDLPADFLRIVQRAVAHDPAERFATAGRMEEALGASLGVESAAPAAGPPVERVTPSRRPAVWMGAALLAGAAALVAWFGLGGGSVYDIRTTLYRVAQDGGQTELRSGDSVAPGDKLTLEFQASAELWVYVLERDARGRAYSLFPLRGFDLQNPLPAGERHRLPGVRDGVPSSWRVDTVGEREELLIVASRERLPEFEIELGKLDEPDASQIRTRGIGSLSALPRRLDDAIGDDAFRMAEQLADEYDGNGATADGRWIRRVALINDG